MQPSSVPARAIALRVGAALVFAVIFAMVLQVSVAGVFQQRSPSLALAWAPYDAQARADLASDLAALKGSSEAGQAARGLALDAIRRSPLSVGALHALGVTAASEGDSSRAVRIMQQAERLSRRNQPTQVWLIEHHLRRGELDEVMRHFDIALRTTSTGRAILFPLLATASKDPGIARATALRLREKPDWGLPFLTHLVLDFSDPQLAVDFTKDYLDPAVPEQLELLRTLLLQLNAGGDYRLAWDVYNRLPANLRPSGNVVDGGFEDSAGFVPFAWALAEEGDLWAARQPAPDGNAGQVLAVGASSGRSGEAARQLLRLPPGAYRIRALAGAVATDPFDRPAIAIRCAGGDAAPVLLTMRPDKAGPKAQRMDGGFSVPAACRFQWLTISIAADVGATDEGPWVDEIRITPAGADGAGRPPGEG